MAVTFRKTRLTGFDWLLHGIGFAVLVLAAGIVVAVVLAPVRESSETNAERIETLTRLLGDAERIRNEHQQLTITLQQTERRAAEMRKRIPEHPSESDFLKEITEAAKSNGLTIQDYRRGAMINEHNHSQLEVSLVGEGSFESICEFVDRTARLPRISKVTRLQIGGEESDSAYPLEMTFVLYFGLKQQANKG